MCKSVYFRASLDWLVIVKFYYSFFFRFFIVVAPYENRDRDTYWTTIFSVRPLS